MYIISLLCKIENSCDITADLNYLQQTKHRPSAKIIESLTTCAQTQTWHMHMLYTGVHMHTRVRSKVEVVVIGIGLRNSHEIWMVTMATNSLQPPTVMICIGIWCTNVQPWGYPTGKSRQICAWMFPTVCRIVQLFERTGNVSKWVQCSYSTT